MKPGSPFPHVYLIVCTCSVLLKLLLFLSSLRVVISSHFFCAKILILILFTSLSVSGFFTMCVYIKITIHWNLNIYSPGILSDAPRMIITNISWNHIVTSQTWNPILQSESQISDQISHSAVLHYLTGLLVPVILCHYCHSALFVGIIVVYKYKRSGKHYIFHSFENTQSFTL